MPTLPLALKAYQRSDGLVPEVLCRNFLLEKDESGISPDQTIRVQRPGLSSVATLPAPIRALSERPMDGSRLAVSGNDFYRNEGLRGSLFGDSARAVIVSTAFADFVLSGSRLYSDTMAFAEIQPPEGQSIVDIDQLKNYLLAFMASGRIYWIEPGETAFDALNFVNAESQSDGGVAIRRVGDEVWAFGTRTIEPFQATGDFAAPFQPVTGRVYERGCLSRDSVRRFDNTLVWVGDDRQVYRGGGVPTVISDNGISERIRKSSDLASAWTFGVDGHNLYVLDIPGQGAFAYDVSVQTWSEFASPNEIGWDAHVGYQSSSGAVYGGSKSGGTIALVSPINVTDYGVPFERVCTATVGIMGVRTRNDSFSAGVGCSADTSLRLRWRDGQDDYPEFYEELEVSAPFDVVSLFRLGQPLQPYREFEVSFTGPERVRIAGAKVNEAYA